MLGSFSRCQTRISEGASFNLVSCQFIRLANVPRASWHFRGHLRQSHKEVEPANVAVPAIMKPARRIKFPRFENRIGGGSSMVITAAHIQPIVALIAGVLILIMPRFLNLVVAIYLIFIGLSGLGVFKMLHF
jgi:hypothetical protein